MAKHWQMRLENEQFLFYQLVVDGIRVADMNMANVGRTEAAALARLIEAAPDLLAACEALHVRLFREQGGQENSPWAAPLELLSRAIAKAKGK